MATNGTQQKPQQPAQQRCCLGLLYYSEALAAENKRPVCAGLSHTPSEHIRLEDNKLLREQQGFKFMCMGHSMYEVPGGQQQQQRGGSPASSSQVSSLPYCEGLEVVVASTADAAAGQHAPGSSGRQPEEWTVVLGTMFGGEDSPVVRGAARFGRVAQRNWDRMRGSASQAYTMTLKPLFDKLMGDQ